MGTVVTFWGGEYYYYLYFHLAEMICLNSCSYYVVAPGFEFKQYFPSQWPPSKSFMLPCHREVMTHFFSFFLVFFLAGLKFELRALHLQGRHSTCWTISAVHFTLVIFRDGVSWAICLCWPQLSVLPISASQVLGLQAWAAGTWLMAHFFIITVVNKKTLLGFYPALSLRAWYKFWTQSLKI
jgi:hypothetical protein